MNHEQVDCLIKDKEQYMICSNCGRNIMTSSEGEIFDIFDTSWECENCGARWYSSSNWYRMGNLLIPLEYGQEEGKRNDT